MIDFLTWVAIVLTVSAIALALLLPLIVPKDPLNHLEHDWNRHLQRKDNP